MSFAHIETVHIDRPAADVFTLLSDFEQNPRWQGGMVSCRWTSDAQGEVGSTYVQEARFLGRRIDTHFVVTEFEPGRLIGIESTASTFPIQVTRTVVPLDETSCEVRAHVRGQPSGLLALFGGIVRRSVAKDYRELKALLES